MTESTSPLTIQVIVAHPDDADFAAAGTTAQWTAAGHHVHYCIITDGAAGGRHTGVSREELARLRTVEQRAAAAALGVKSCTFLGFRDGELEVTPALRKEITRAIRTVRPNRVVCQSPERNWERIYASHPDHLAAGAAVLAAVYPDARNPYAYPELLEEGIQDHVVESVWVAGGPNPDVINDISDVFEQKISALACHASQIDDLAAFTDRIRAMGHGMAQRFNHPTSAAVEVFRTIDTR